MSSPARGVVTVCGGCPSECAFRAVAMPDGSVEAAVPVEGHPCRTARLCDRGTRRLRLPSVTRNRIEHPLCRLPDGTFAEVAWDEAYASIAGRMRSLMDEGGPEALALTTGLASSARLHAERLMRALGSPNVYGAAGACDVSRLTGWRHTLGYSPESDVAHTDYIVYLGRSPLESASATEGDLVRAALDRGAQVVAVDPRRNPTVEQATDWLRIRPGRDLALLLGIAHVLWKRACTTGSSSPATPPASTSSPAGSSPMAHNGRRGSAASRPRTSCVWRAGWAASVPARWSTAGSTGASVSPT